MHAFRLHLLVLPFILILSSYPLHAEEPKQEHYWYRVEVQTGDSTYQCIGNSLLDEKAFSGLLKDGAAVLLEDAAYIDANGKIKSWQDWDPKATAKLYLNSRYVILVNPLKGDPRKPSQKK